MIRDADHRCRFGDRDMHFLTHFLARFLQYEFQFVLEKTVGFWEESSLQQGYAHLFFHRWNAGAIVCNTAWLLALSLPCAAVVVFLCS